MYLGDDKFGLQPLWEELISVYDEFARICDRHGLRYYVTDGNAIGALRHGGFIPWDDDLDVSMPYPDYKLFLSLYKNELPSHLKVVTWRNTTEFNLLFAKIQDVRKNRIGDLEKKMGITLSNGVFLDIFPIYGYPKGMFSLLRYRFLTQFYRSLIRFRFDLFSRQTLQGKILWIIGLLLMPFCPWLWSRDKILEKMEKLNTEVDFEDAIFTGRTGMVKFRGIPKDAWGKGVELKFGDRTLRFPSDAKKYLEVEYGDFMQLPPENKRQPSHSYSWRCPWWLGPTQI